MEDGKRIFKLMNELLPKKKTIESLFEKMLRQWEKIWILDLLGVQPLWKAEKREERESFPYEKWHTNVEKKKNWVFCPTWHAPISRIF